MVSSLEEVTWARERLDKVVEGGERPLFGLMIETPAAAVLADRLAPLIDFVSIGTNYLTQYALAMDREHPDLTDQCDGLHPAVLRLIAQTVAGARSTKWIGVCGGLASDPLAAPILIGLGVTELSVAPASVPAIKAVIRRLTMADCQALARKALTTTSAEAVRAIARVTLAPVLTLPEAAPAAAPEPETPSSGDAP
jgi:phosphoenolpyruvate-protein kinase (PTS system EI component)